MEIEFINTHIPLYIESAKLTLSIAAAGIILSVIIGLICSMFRYFKIPGLGKAADFYIELARNTPLLIQLFFLYFGLPKLGIMLSSKACAVTGLAFLGGSYMAEAFRSGLDNVSEVQAESALSLGMKKYQVFFYIVLPQAAADSIPAFCANIIFLIKETSVFSAVALADLMYITKDLIGIYYNTDESLLMLVIAYMVILLPVSVICTIVERRMRYVQYGN